MMRHVSLLHRVALDWLFDRINLDPKIQIKYIDTKHQLADILTTGNYTRDERNNLLRVFNISNLSSVCCFETRCPTSVSKRLQEEAGQKKRVMAESKPMITVVSMTVGRSSTMPSPSASGIPVGDQGKKFIILILSSSERDLWQERRFKKMARALKRGNECQRTGFVRDSDALRRFTGSALAWQTVPNTRIFPRVQWSTTTSCSKWQKHSLHYGKPFADR